MFVLTKELQGLGLDVELYEKKNVVEGDDVEEFRGFNTN
jgi:hypothetical protein